MSYKRIGECNPKQCNHACCLFSCENFNGNDCILGDSRPESCKAFPSRPDDEMYLRVKDVCTYGFEEVEEDG